MAGKASPKKIAPITSLAHSEVRNSAAPTSAPGSPIDLVFSFDTTGSMYSCLAEVRKNLENMIGRILKDIPNIRIAVSAYIHVYVYFCNISMRNIRLLSIVVLKDRYFMMQSE